MALNKLGNVRIVWLSDLCVAHYCALHCGLPCSYVIRNTASVGSGTN